MRGGAGPEGGGRFGRVNRMRGGRVGTLITGGRPAAAVVGTLAYDGGRPGATAGCDPASGWRSRLSTRARAVPPGRRGRAGRAAGHMKTRVCFRTVDHGASQAMGGALAAR